MDQFKFYKGQRVKAAELTSLQTYTDESQAELVSSLLGAGVVDGFKITSISGFLLRVASGCAFSHTGTHLILEEAKQINLSNYTPNVDTIKIKIGIEKAWLKSEPVLDSMGNTVYKKWTPTVKIVTGNNLEAGVFELGEVTISPVGVDSVKNTAIVFDTMPKVEEKLLAEIEKTNARTASFVTEGDTAKIEAQNITINGYPYLRVDMDIVTKIPRYLRVPDNELGKIKTNKIELLCDNIIIKEKAYTPPPYFMNTLNEVGTDVLVVAHVLSDQLAIKLIDHTETDYTLLDGEVILGGYHIGASREYDKKGFCKINTTEFIGIVEDSFWTPKFRPESDPRGMVYTGNNIWWDIYLNSMDWVNEKPILVSKYDRVMATGSINTVQHNNLCQYGLCWLDVNNLLVNAQKTFPNTTDYYRMTSSQPLLVGDNSISESMLKKTGRYYQNENGVCKSVNNYGITDLFNIVGCMGEKTTYTTTSGSWNYNEVKSFLRDEKAQNIFYYEGRTESIAVLGWNYTTGNASSSLTLLYYLNRRSWYLGCRGVSITQH